MSGIEAVGEIKSDRLKKVTECEMRSRSIENKPAVLAVAAFAYFMPALASQQPRRAPCKNNPATMRN